MTLREIDSAQFSREEIDVLKQIAVNFCERIKGSGLFLLQNIVFKERNCLSLTDAFFLTGQLGGIRDTQFIFQRQDFAPLSLASVHEL
jgi:hypothetical protein